MGLFRNYYGKQKYKQYTRNGLIAMILIIVAVITLFPIYYMVISSFGAPTEAGGASYSLIPKSFSLDSYKFFFEYSEYSFRWILNSFIVAAVVTVSNVFFASLAGYAFAKLRFPGCRFFLLPAACSNDGSISGYTGAVIHFGSECITDARYLSGSDCSYLSNLL